MENKHIDQLLKDGIAAAKAVQTHPTPELKERAWQLLSQVTELDKTNPRGWLWLSTVIDNVDDKMVCLRNVLLLDPANQAAQEGLAILQQQEADSTGNSQVMESPICPFCQQPLPGSVTSCPHCESPLVVACPKCTTLVDVEWETCSNCHHPMPNIRAGSIYFTLLAEEYRGFNRTHKALEALYISEKLDPDQPDLYRQIGEVLGAMNQSKEAIEVLKKAIVREPGQMGPFLALGRVLQQDGRWEEAEAIFREARDTAPDSAEAYYALGHMLLQRNELDNAQKNLRKATKLDPQHGLAWNDLAQVYDRRKNTKVAAQAFSRSLRYLEKDGPEWNLAQERLSIIGSPMPEHQARSWREFAKQISGPVLVSMVVAVIGAGVTWNIGWRGWLAIGLGLIGATLWVSANSLPRNPVIRFLTGNELGLTDLESPLILGAIGVVIWVSGIALFFII
jgi:tetratricopeptide (TPR) repeat protein